MSLHFIVATTIRGCGPSKYATHDDLRGHPFLTVRGARVYVPGLVHPRARAGDRRPSSIGHWIEGRNQLENQKESENNARAKKKRAEKKGSHSGWKLRKRGEMVGRERAISGN